MATYTTQPLAPARKSGLFARIAPAIALFFVAPLVAEFLLGNLPIKLLPALIVLAPMYGGGALLIREFVRRTGHGWPSIFLLGAAYAIFEEAFTTQSLFNPDYLSMKMHLLDPAWVPALGMGGWWTVFMLNLHPFWSIATPIALIEAAVPGRAQTPWLGRTGSIVTGVLLAFGSVASTLLSYKKDHFLSSHLQFASAAVACVLLVATAFLLPRRTAPLTTGWAPNPWLAGALTLAAGSGVLLTPSSWGWGAVAALLAVDLTVLAAMFFWSRSAAWTPLHKLALAAGATLAYGWHAFVEKPVIPGSLVSTRVGNAVFFLGAVLLIWLGAKRTAAAIAQDVPPTPLS